MVVGIDWEDSDVWHIKASLSVVFFPLFKRTQPQRNMRWLHRLLHHCYQVLAQLVQVNFIAQRGTEVRDNFGCVVFTAVEAAIDDPLNTMTQGLEEHVDGQRGDDDGHTVVLADNAPQER